MATRCDDPSGRFSTLAGIRFRARYRLFNYNYSFGGHIVTFGSPLAALSAVKIAIVDGGDESGRVRAKSTGALAGICFFASALSS